jgi:hypothetical protein
MRALFSLPVLDDATGEIIGLIAPRPGMMTSMGSIMQVEGPGAFIFSDSNGVLAMHGHAKPWVEEAEARGWGFSTQCETCAVAV